MIAVQILNKILASGSSEIITRNSLTAEYFVGYEAEYSFIMDHQATYNKVPSVITFVAEFPEFPILEVTESDRYLIDAINEEHLYYTAVPVIQKAAELLKTDSTTAVDYLRSQLPTLSVQTQTTGEDIISKAGSRLQVYKDKMAGGRAWTITTGFEELDTVLNGWARGEELVVFFARTGQGKSWVLAKTLAHAWQIGYRVGYISPEMSPVKIGYRFDTLIKNFSNTNLIRGAMEPNYEPYIEELKAKENPFFVATPADFQKRLTVTKLRNFILTNKLDIIGIDGITYMVDERYHRGDTKTITLTNISEDLSALSLELGVPIIVVVQSNRGGVKEEESGTPELENIRDSDGIAQNATKVVALRQTGAGLEFGIKKHRDGMSGGKLIYFWDIDHGVFRYIPSDQDAAKPEQRQTAVENNKKVYKDKKDVF